ncbi:MAG: alpha/beta fold hydrolase [Ilumatobacteraceae bacterium]
MPHVHTADGVTIDYSTVGSGAPVVLVHGITESRAAWDPIVPPLADAGYRVISVDLRGHGASSMARRYDLGSMAADVAAVVEAVDADEGASGDAGDGSRPLLIGHSLGGAVVSAAAAAMPVRGVINVDQSLALAGFKEGLGQIEPMLRGSPEAFAMAMAAIFDQLVGPLAPPERARIEALRQPRQAVVLGIWDLVLTASADELDAQVAALAGAIRAPYLSLHGVDPGDHYAAWLGERIASATVEVWPGQGHYPHLVDPVRFVSRVLAFDPRD